MNLTFSQDAKGRFIAEFEITDKAALHIERARNASMYFYQKSSPNEDYAFIKDGDTRAAVFDTDLTALVYPKYIKIISYEQPTLATLTSDGEITEIVAQSKSVEVTANGSVTITPDSGFGYLSEVVVNTNVPQEGGGTSEKPMYIGIQIINTYDNSVIPLAISSEYTTWGEAADSGLYPIFNNGGSNGTIYIDIDNDVNQIFHNVYNTLEVRGYDELISGNYYFTLTPGGGGSGN